MKKSFIHVLTIALIAALAFGCLAGCTAAPKTEQVTPATPTTSATTETSADPAAATDLSGKKVALVLFGTNFDYFVYIGASAKKTAEEAGIQLDVLNASDFVDLSEKVSQVVTIKYDACIVIGLPAIMADYQALGEAGIPVITYDSMVDGFDFSARVGSDNYVLGTQAAEEAIKYLESLDEINGEVICLNCPEGETMNSRARGFMDTIAARFPELTVNEQKLGVADSTAEGAQTYVDNKLHIPENIELFYIPPYTPEMNPIEQIWKELRITGFRNEVFATLEKVVDRLCDNICTLTSDTIKNITRCSWIINCFN